MSKMLTVLQERILITLLLLALSGCGSFKPSSPLPLSPVVVPQAPAEIMEPEDLSESYSEIVLKLLQNWAKRLTDWKTKS